MTINIWLLSIFPNHHLWSFEYK